MLSLVIYVGIKMKKALLMVMLIPSIGWGSVVLNSTRVVFNDGGKETNLRINNDNPHPVLVQSWIEDRQSTTTKIESSKYFIVTPPVYKMEQGTSQIIRIIKKSDDLPGNKESVFWLNVLEVPPSITGENTGNALRLAFKTRIKVFYRPKGMSSPTDEYLHEAITCSKTNSSNGSEELECNNSSPYHLSFSSAKIKTVRGLKDITDKNLMIAPFGKSRVDLEGADSASSLVYVLINDYGAAVSGELAL